MRIFLEIVIGIANIGITIWLAASQEFLALGMFWLGAVLTAFNGALKEK